MHDYSLNEKLKILATKEEIEKLATKAELKPGQDKIEKLENDFSYYLGKILFVDVVSQVMFVYQPTHSMLEL